MVSRRICKRTRATSFVKKKRLAVNARIIAVEEPARFMDVVNALFQSPVYQNYGAIMTEHCFEQAGFKMKLGMKDVELAIKAAQFVSAPLPLDQLIHNHFAEGMKSR
jgi:3-hydroxyisobutyrate dehydrogenase-like beta-hydroxyacid dehydrogenase